MKPDKNNIHVVVIKSDAINTKLKGTRHHISVEEAVDNKSFWNLQFVDKSGETEEMIQQ